MFCVLGFYGGMREGKRIALEESIDRKRKTAASVNLAAVEEKRCFSCCLQSVVIPGNDI